MNYTVIAPEAAREGDLLAEGVWPCFDPRVLDFIDELSRRILTGPHYRGLPELMALAFWMRKANLARLQQSFESETAGSVRLGRGLAFHIAPSNVDTIFVYSWFLSMLVGNTNVVRLSSRSNPQIDALTAVINAVAREERFADVARRFLIVRYEHSTQVTAHFSEMCDLRVIWGGDETIKAIRAVPLRPTATELTFADKFSLAVIDARRYLELARGDDLARAFFNDAYMFDQLACSSPRVVFWVGSADAIAQARESFWKALESVLQDRKLQLPPSSATDKEVALQQTAIQSASVRVEPSASNLLRRAWLENPADIRRETHCGQGLFYEAGVSTLDGILPFITSKEQTIVTIGIPAGEWRQFILRSRPRGINRVVPAGEALTFSPIWDSYELLREFTRVVTIGTIE